MTKASDNVFPKLIGSEGAAPGTPAAATAILYVKADGLWYSKDDAGAETLVSGGSSGAVGTDAIWDVKGDLAGGTGANTAVRLAVGANGTVLTAASGEATGLKWASFVGASAYHNAAQTITTATDTVLAMNSERYDTDAFHDTVTNNSRLTVPTGKDGKYLVTLNIAWASVAAAGIREARLKLNGTTHIALQTATATSTTATRQSVSAVVDLVATNYVEAFVRQESGGNLNVDSSSQYSPEFTISKIG